MIEKRQKLIRTAECRSGSFQLSPVVKKNLYISCESFIRQYVSENRTSDNRFTTVS